MLILTLMTTPEDYGITLYTWNNGLLDVHQNVIIRYKTLIELPFNFGIIEGFFDCSKNSLKSLKGCPREVRGDFYCNNNELNSLKGCPKIVNGNFSCSKNQLTSLKGCPEIINGSFYCNDNHLTSLEFGPETVDGSYRCDCNKLTSLNFGPKIVNGTIDCSFNKLSSLKLSPDKITGNFYFHENELDLSLNDLLELTIKYTNFYKSVDVVESPDKQTTIYNLQKKISISNMVMGIR